MLCVVDTQQQQCQRQVTPSNRVANEQHHLWGTLGFIRSIATTPTICQALSTPQWITLLLQILAQGDETAPNVSQLQRQVSITTLLSAMP